MQYEQSWRRMWQELGVDQADPALLQALLDHYSEPHRKYHTLQHLDACFAHFAKVRDQAEHPAEVELALWFHDAIYEIRAASNEQRSADWAGSEMLARGLEADASGRVHSLVTATCHNVLPKTPDEALLLDVDLSILGAPTPVFDNYELQIRAENASVNEASFRNRRRAILQGFLSRERIYLTPYFNARLEAQARANLARSIAALEDT